MNTYEFTLELNKGPRYRTGSGFKEVTIRKGDLNGTTIVADIYDHGTKITTANLSAVFEMLQPDGEHYYRETAEYDSGTVSITLDESFAGSVAGTTDLAYFRLYQGSQVIASTESFRVTILRSAEDEGDDPAISYDDAVPAAVNVWLEDHPEATTTVQDDSLTTAKYQDDSVTASKLASDAVTTPKLADNNVTDEKLSATGVLAKANRLLGNVLRGTATGAVAQAHGTYAAPPLGLTVHGRSVQDGTPTPSSPVAIQSVGDVVVVQSSANMLKNNGTTQTINGVTFTVNADGSVTANGTASANAWFEVNSGMTLPTACFLSGRPTTGISGSAQLQTSVGGTVYPDNGSGISVPAGQVDTVYIVIRKDAVCTNAVFRPMLNVGSSALPYEKAAIEQRLIDLNGLNLRMLPDGTRDTISVDGSGNVTVTRNVGVMRLTDLTWTQVTGSDNGAYFKTDVTNWANPASGVATPACCETLVASTSSNVFDGSFARATGSSSVLYIRDLARETVDDLLSYHGNSHFAYPLATPTTESLGQVDLQELHSLPDGTRDEVTVDADGNVTLIRRTTTADAASIIAAVQTPTELTDYVRIPCGGGGGCFSETTPQSNTSGGLCNIMSFTGGGYNTNSMHCYTNLKACYLFAPRGDKATWNETTAREWVTEHSPHIIAKLATPVTVPLGKLTLPPMPKLASPEATAWATTTPATTVTLDYERDLTAAITAIESAIADMA